MVEPGPPLQAVYAFPWPSLVDQFGLVEAIDGLCPCVVVAAFRTQLLSVRAVQPILLATASMATHCDVWDSGQS